MLVCAFFLLIAHGTVGAARTRHSLRPLNSEGDAIRKTSRRICGENAGICLFIGKMNPFVPAPARGGIKACAGHALPEPTRSHAVIRRCPQASNSPFSEAKCSPKSGTLDRKSV